MIVKRTHSARRELCFRVVLASFTTMVIFQSYVQGTVNSSTWDSGQKHMLHHFGTTRSAKTLTVGFLPERAIVII